MVMYASTDLVYIAKNLRIMEEILHQQNTLAEIRPIWHRLLFFNVYQFPINITSILPVQLGADRGCMTAYSSNDNSNNNKELHLARLHGRLRTV